jgi:hypothetical protein
MRSYRENPHKVSYSHLLTPTGLAEKAVLPRRFLQSKMTEYQKLRGEIEVLQLECDHFTGEEIAIQPPKKNK